MSITVYWACSDKEWLRAKEPANVFKDFVGKEKSKNITLNFCPAFKNYLNNVYKITSIYDYEFKTDGEVVTSDMYDQNFYNDHVGIRSIKDKSFSFANQWTFFTEKDSLEISLSAPILEDNYIAKNCTFIPGKFDIGKWFRVIDVAFYLKEGVDIFKVKEGDALQYLTFHTNEKIIFKQFMVNDTIKQYLLAVDNSRKNRNTRPRDLNQFYKMFKNKKRIIKEIKKNLID